MEASLLRVWLTRLVLVVLPLAIYIAWQRWHISKGREVGATPWGWLIGAGAVLAGLSMMASVIFQPDHVGRTYLPGQTQTDGSVRPGRFE
jgi:hypothetical protein